jgi:hypothetical protein
MNGLQDVLLTLIRYCLEVLLIDWGKTQNWDALKTEMCARIDKVIPNSTWDTAAKYVASVLVDLVAEYFTNAKVDPAAPTAKDVLDQAWTYAMQNLLRRIATTAATVPAK